jgi:hypothetical protein
MGRTAKGVAKSTKKVPSAKNVKKGRKKTAERKVKKVEDKIDLTAILVEEKTGSDESEDEEEEVEDVSGGEEAVFMKSNIGKSKHFQYLSDDSTDVSSDEESNVSDAVNDTKKGVAKGKKSRKTTKVDTEDATTERNGISKGKKIETGKKGKKDETPSPGRNWVLSDVDRGGHEEPGQNRVDMVRVPNHGNTESIVPSTPIARQRLLNRDQVVRSGRNSSGGSINRSSIQIRDLASFGFNPAPAGAEDGNGANNGNHNTSEIRIAIVGGVNGHSDILFRCEPTGYGNRNYSWCEKLMYDAVRATDSWTSRMNISKNVFYWYHNNVEQVNRGGYGIRMFHIPVIGNTNNDALVEVFSHICDLISTSERNSERITVNPSHMFWLQGQVVWSDVVGNTKAMLMLKKKLGSPYPGFYEANEDEILTYFKEDNTEAMIELFGPVLERNEE